MSGYVRAFNRWELKYLIHHSLATEFVQAISAHVDYDQNVGREGFYKVASLYYDSPGLSCFWEKLDGEKFRRKVRVRTYGEQPEYAFAEIKQRYNKSVQKRRCRAPLEVVSQQMQAMRNGKYQGGVDPVFDEIFLLTRRLNLRETVIVSYNRMAFFDRYKADLRITIDRNIRARNLDLNLTQHRTKGRHMVAPTSVVLEVKFNETIPRWLCTVLSSFDLQIDRVSKYCTGVEALGMHLKKVLA